MTTKDIQLMTLQQIRVALADRNLAKVAAATGYTRSYLSAVRAGRADNPTLMFLSAMTLYFAGDLDLSEDAQ